MTVGKNWDEFVQAVATMRKYQKQYRNTKNRDYLVSSQEAAGRVDFMLKTLIPEEDE